MDLTAKQFRPEPVNEARDHADYLPCEWINNRYELVHKPFDWEVKDGKWLPVLSPIYMIDGLNNYNTDGVRDPENVRNIYRRKSCECIPPEDDRLGEFKGYMMTIPSYNPQYQSSRVGKYWVTMFDAPVMVAGQVSWERDAEEYDRFRQHLVDVGICVMNATIAKMVIKDRKERLKDYLQIPTGNESKSRTRAIALLEETIKSMEALVGGLEKPAPAAQPNRKFKAERAPVGAGADE